jgi:integrase/recombinase XerD
MADPARGTTPHDTAPCDDAVRGGIVEPADATASGGEQLGWHADTWLATKRLTETDSQRRKGNSDRARADDLARWGRLLSGRIEPLNPHQRSRTQQPATHHLGQNLDPVTDLNTITADELTTARIVTAVDTARSRCGYSSATMHRMIGTLTQFCDHLVTAHILTTNPARVPQLRLRRDPDRLIRAPDTSTVDTLLDAAAHPRPRRRTRWPARDIALIELLTGTGLRVSELVNLTDSDIDRTGTVTFIRVDDSKGGAVRTIPVSTHVAEWTDRWIAERDTALRTPISDRLFVRRNGQPFTRQAVDHLLRTIADDGGVTFVHGAVAHGLRHRYGLELAAHGVTALVAAQLLGHASPTTTLRYSRARTDDLASVLTAAGLLT